MKKSKADGLCGESGIDRDSVWIGGFQDYAVSFPGNNWFHYEGSRKCSLYRSSVFLVSGITIILILPGTHNSYGVHMGREDTGHRFTHDAQDHGVCGHDHHGTEDVIRSNRQHWCTVLFSAWVCQP